MGTVFTLDVREPGSWDDAIAEVVAWLHEVDARFSTYRADSDISRIRRQELAVVDAHPDVADALDLCARVETDTGGHFTAFWDGNVDPTGLVKGWAIEHAARILTGHGSGNHAVNGGGDVQAVGGAGPTEPWRIGISDPRDPSNVVAVVEGRDVAIATSGTTERGDHIVNPVTGRIAGELASVTVIGPSLTFVDAYATAAFAMGSAAGRWLEGLVGHRAILVTTDGAVTDVASVIT